MRRNLFEYFELVSHNLWRTSPVRKGFPGFAADALCGEGSSSVVGCTGLERKYSISYISCNEVKDLRQK